MHQRFDRFALAGASWELTPQGGLRVPARVARVGELDYGDHVEVRTLEALADVESIRSLDSAPVVVTHLDADGQPTMVDPSDWRERAVGDVADGSASIEADQYLRCWLVIQDADAIARIQGGQLVEISAGYTCDVDDAGLQRNVRYNHVALLPSGQGRAGAEVSIRMDSMAKRRLDGLEEAEEKKTDDDAAPVDGEEKHDEETVELEIKGKQYQLPKELAEAFMELQQLLAEHEKTELSEGKEDACAPAEKTDSRSIEQLASERADLIVAAREAGVADRGSNADIMRRILGKSGARLDSLSSQELKGAFSYHMATRRSAQGSRTLVRQIHAAPRQDAADHDPRAAYLERMSKVAT